MSIKSFLAFVLFATSLHGAVFSFVQVAGAAATATTVTFSSSNTAGNIIIAAMGSPGGFPATSVTDSQGNTYTQVCYPLQANAGGSFNGALYVATGIAGGSSNTVTFHGINVGSNEWSLVIAEYAVPSNFNISSIQTADNDQMTSFVVTFPFAKIGSAHLPSEIMIIPIVWANVSAIASSNGTIRLQQASGSTFRLSIADYDVTSPSSPVATTITESGGGTYEALGMSLALDTGAGSGSSVPAGFGFVAKLEKKKSK